MNNADALGEGSFEGFGYDAEGEGNAGVKTTLKVNSMDEARSDPSCRQLRVLVVEDDTDMRWAIRDVLMMRGHLVNTAQNGTAAAALAADDDYDAVITDIRLPGMSGIELTRNIQRSGRPPKVIVITAYPEWHKDAQVAGASRIIRKPLNLALLARIVEQAAEWQKEKE